MARYIENLNECTNPAAGDYLLGYDASAPSNDKDRKFDIARFAIIATDNSVTVPHLRSYAVTVAQNNVAVITPTQTLGMILIAPNFFPDASGIATYRAAGSGFCQALAAGANFNTTTGVLTGTTGANGKVTISAHTDGKIYIEQRRASEIAFRITFLC